MFARGKINSTEDFFKSVVDRGGSLAYFYRINSYNSDTDSFIRRFYESAMKCGAVIEGNIPNPTESNLSYYNEIMGMDFRRDKEFISAGLKKWLPRMNPYQTEAVASSMCKVLDGLAAAGKNDNMLKNAYIKFMCWLYYKFAQVVSNLNSNTVPKILYEGNVSKYELLLLSVLCECGCDVVMLCYSGGGDYLKTDPKSEYCDELSVTGGTTFPQDFSVKKIREDLRAAAVAPITSQTQAQTQPSAGRAPALKFTGSSGVQPMSAPQTPTQTPQEQPAPRRGIQFTGFSDTPAMVNREPAPTPQPAPQSRPSSVKFTGVSDRPATIGGVQNAQSAQDGANRTNTWIKKRFIDDIKTPASQRGNEAGKFYNCFYKISGVEEQNAYVSDLYKLREALTGEKRKLVILEGSIPKPSNDEIGSIRRQNYTSAENMAASLAVNISFPLEMPLQKIMMEAFRRVMLEEYARSGNLNKETGKAVYLLCWLKRYQTELFKNRTAGSISCFIKLGGCGTEQEAAFMRMLAKLPTDVLVLVPNKEENCLLADESLFVQSFDGSAVIDKYPTSLANMRTSTAAANAERQLGDMMYGSTGQFRRNQYRKAEARVLETTYDEIAILWNQEMKFRPNFDAGKTEADIPVIFAKVSGVRNKDMTNYWLSVKNLITDNTVVIKNPPFVDKQAENPIKKAAPSFIINKKLRREAIKAHGSYRYGHLREEMQEHILDKIQALLDSGLINGTFRNGMENIIVAEALNLDKRILRQIQDFDFTRKNPKVIYINTTENSAPPEDGIVMALLNLIGFDVVFFVPTGYRSIEGCYTFTPFCEHQIGDYEYDLTIPDFNMLKKSFKDWIREKVN